MVERHVGGKIIGAGRLHELSPISLFKSRKSSPGIRPIKVRGETAPHIELGGAEALAEAHDLPHEEIGCHERAMTLARSAIGVIDRIFEVPDLKSCERLVFEKCDHKVGF